MIRAIWDTNTLASGAIARQGVIAVLIDGWRHGDFEIVVSEHILTELERALRKPYFAARLNQADREEFLARVREFANIVQIAEPIPSVLPDRADNMVLATAVSARAPYIVSGDRELQGLGSYQNVRIFSAREFFDLVIAPRVSE